MYAFIERQLKRGRAGGVISILAALGIVLLVYLDLAATGSFFIALPPLALALLVIGIVLLIWGGAGKTVQLPDDTSAPAPAELIRLLHAQQRPFHFCTRCRRVAEGKMCDQCGTRADCLKTEDEDDIKMALAAMS